MNSRRVATAQFALTAALLTANFAFNSFRSADPSFFAFVQWGPEGHVIARMLIVEKEGLLSYAGLLGKCTSDSPRAQHAIYLHDEEVTGYVLYKSQVGLQGQVAAAFDTATTFDRRTTLALLHFATALLTALAMSVLLVWLGRTFGVAAWAAALLGTLYSPWVTVLAKNLYWASWAFYLPLCAVIGLLWLERGGRSASVAKIAAGTFAAVLVKCLFNGYEFMTTTLLMMVTPVAMVAALDRWPLGKLVRWGVTAGVGSAAAVLATVLVLCGQIAIAEGSFSEGVDHLFGAFERRSRGEFGDYPAGFDRALRASTWEVLGTYASGTAIGFDSPNDGMRPQDLPTWGRITYGDLLTVFALFSGVGLGVAWWLRGRGRVSAKLVALVVGTWFGSLASLSWLVLFKAHAYIHTNVDFIVWHMPFVPVAFAMCGQVLAVGGTAVWARVRARGVSGPATPAS